MRLSWGSLVKGPPRPEGAYAAPPAPGQELRLRLESSQAVAAWLREQLSESRQELQASRRLLQEREREQVWDREDLLRKLEAQGREAQHCRATSELLRR